MDASRKPSIATEVHASYERPHRLALLATSPVATGEAKIGPPQGDGNFHSPVAGAYKVIYLRTRTPQGDGNSIK